MLERGLRLCFSLSCSQIWIVELTFAEGAEVLPLHPTCTGFAEWVASSDRELWCNAKESHCLSRSLSFLSTILTYSALADSIDNKPAQKLFTSKKCQHICVHYPCRSVECESAQINKVI